MKMILMAFVMMAGMAAQAQYEEDFAFRACASNDSGKSVIANLLNKVDIFGTWVGELDGEEVIVDVSISNGRYMGHLIKGDTDIGPTGISLCDNNGQFAVKVYWYDAPFTVQSKTQITITLPINGNPKVVMTKAD